MASWIQLTWIESLFAVPVLGGLLQLLLLVLLFFVVRRLMQSSSRRLEAQLERTVLDLDRRTRLQTLLRAGYATAIAVWAMIIGAMALQALGISIGPLLASAGVAGLAISLAAQSLIRDYINGVLILVEDQFRVGDVIDVDGVAGEVVRMTLRVTYLRNLEGKLHSVPNGDIRIITNLTREWSRAVVDLNLEPRADLDQAVRALESAMARLQADPEYREALIAPPEILGWNNLTDWAVQVRLMAKTLPGKQWAVGRALRRYAVEALQEEGLRLALPMTVLQERRPA